MRSCDMHFLLVDIRDAVKNFSRRPLRFFLSSLGIGIGVAALIAMLSISEGAKEQALAKIRSLGTGTLRVESTVTSAGGQDSQLNLSQGLTMEDGRRITAWLGGRGDVALYMRKDSILARKATKRLPVTVLGVNDPWFRVEKLKTESGRLLTARDIEKRSNYCVIGAAVAEQLHVDMTLLEQGGATIQLGGFVATVIGVLERKGRLLTEGTGLSSLDFDNLVILPISSTPYAQYIADRPRIDGIVISLTEKAQKQILVVAEQIETMLSSAHRKTADFTLVVPRTLLEKVRENQRLFSLIMAIIAGLSLVVGGIGVMNVMLANIAEQTREIGLRMAVGASKRRIVRLFLLHSILLTLMGSIWGLVAGTGLALGIQYYAGWKIVFSSISIFIAPFAAIVTGVLFGLHPALRAASLDPATALRDA
jgi:putative ABC transport system permease protein